MRKLLIGLLCMSSALANAQSAGTQAMMELKDAIEKRDYSNLTKDVQKSIETGSAGADAIATSAEKLPPKFTADMGQSVNEWQKALREGLVAAYPPRDQARARQILIGDGADTASPGKLYYFVSRSMPVGLLRAYALDAFYMGGTLVVKGLRRGDTLKEYVEEAIQDYNATDGMLLSALEINPNLFDIFDVNVVPTVVWTTKAGLDEGNSGCEHPDATFGTPKITLSGPDDEPLTVDRPVCVQAVPSTYYKLSGAINSNYVLDRFQEAGAPKDKMNELRKRLARRHDKLTQAGNSATGNAMPTMPRSIQLDVYPVELLSSWKTKLETHNVQKTALGPDFNNEKPDEPAYREELKRKITEGLAD